MRCRWGGDWCLQLAPGLKWFVLLVLWVEGGVVAGGFEVAGFEFGVVVEDLGFGGAGGEPAENVPDGDAEAADAGMAGAFAGFDGDALCDHGSQF